MVIIRGENFLTRQEFAEATGLSYSSVTNRFHRGIIIPAIINGKKMFYTEDQVEKYLNGEYEPVVMRA